MSPEQVNPALGDDGPKTGPAPTGVVVELRCPAGPRRLFARLVRAGERPPVNSDNLIEMACQDCKRKLRSTGAINVVHRFSILGELIQTVVLYPPEPE